ncbi:hypothetical protein RFI_09567, partial [Reticulomyxa filosa]
KTKSICDTVVIKPVQESACLDEPNATTTISSPQPHLSKDLLDSLPNDHDTHLKRFFENMSTAIDDHAYAVSATGDSNDSGNEDDDYQIVQPYSPVTKSVTGMDEVQTDDENEGSHIPFSITDSHVHNNNESSFNLPIGVLYTPHGGNTWRNTETTTTQVNSPSQRLFAEAFNITPSTPYSMFDLDGGDTDQYTAPTLRTLDKHRVPETTVNFAQTTNPSKRMSRNVVSVPFFCFDCIFYLFIYFIYLFVYIPINVLTYNTMFKLLSLLIDERVRMYCVVRKSWEANASKRTKQGMQGLECVGILAEK